MAYAHRGWVSEGPEVQTLRPLTPLAMVALQHEPMFDAVADLFRDILNHFPAFLTEDHFRSLAAFLTTNDAQNVVSRIKRGDFDADTATFVRLLLAYGDAAVQDLAQTPENSQNSQILFQLLELLKGDTHAEFESEICAEALEFWMTYTEFAIDAVFVSGESTPNWIKTARQYVEAAVEACWTRIRMPPHEVLITWDPDTKSLFKEFRKDVHDLLQSSYRILGVDVLGKLTLLALQSLKDHAWLPLEATLYCIDALADLTTNEPSADDILSKLFTSSLFADMIKAREPIPAKTRQTTVTMVSRYAAFFEKHPEQLSAMLNFLFGCLEAPALVNAVSKAIFSACSSCRAVLTEDLGTLLQQYETLLTWESIEANVKERIIGAVASVVEALPSEEDQFAPLTQLFQTVEKDAAKCIQGMTTTQSEESQESGITALRCLVSMGKAMQAPDDIIINLDAEAASSTFWTEGQGALLQRKIIEILRTITGLLKWKTEAVEAGCHILRVGYKESTPGPFLFPLQVTTDFVLSGKLDNARLDYVLETAGMALGSRLHVDENALLDTALLFLDHSIGLITSMECKRLLLSYFRMHPLMKHR